MKLETRNSLAFFAIIPWGHLFQRPQQMVMHWPGKPPILYFEPLVARTDSRPWPVREPWGWRIAVPLLPVAARNKHVRRLAGWLSQRTALRRLGRVLLRVWIRLLLLLWRLPPVTAIVCESPQWAPLLSLFPEAPVAFDYMDDLLSFEGVPPSFRDGLRRTLLASDVVIATSEPLRDQLRSLAPVDVQVIGNGVDAEHFNRDRWRGAPPPFLDGLSAPRIVYPGSIGYWLDFPLLERLSEAFPEASFLFLGPVYSQVKERFDALCARPNVHYGGTLPYPELPGWLTHCQGAVIPFLDNDLTRAVNPVKAYEFAALGLPFVSAALPPLAPFKDLATLARTQDEFVVGVREMLVRGTPEPSWTERMKLLAEANSWTSKTSQIAELLTP